MKTFEIKDPTHRMYKAFETLYHSSFPAHAQRSRAQQMEAFKDSAYHLLCFEDQGELLAFISYWTLGSCTYIEHIAVNDKLRGQGNGGRVLRSFMALMNKIVLLEIEPLTDTESQARFRFYQKCGFGANEIEHFHPPYRKDKEPHPLIVMTYGRPVSQGEYEAFKSELTSKVMAITPD